MNLTADDQTVMENRYQYDAMDNILGITNAANPTSQTKINKAKLGGRSSHTYEYDVDQGAIYLNGHDIRDYRLADLRSLMGYVPQDQFLFASSILDNIRFGNPDLPFSDLSQLSCFLYF